MFENILNPGLAQKAISEIAELRATNGASFHNQHASMAITTGLESIQAANYGEVKTTVESIASAIKASSGLHDLLVATHGNNEAAITAGIESATATLIAFQDSANYNRAFAAPSAGDAGVKVLGKDLSAQYLAGGLESFGSEKFEQFAAATIVMNALNASADEFSEALFKTKLIPAGQGGIDVKISVPRAINRMNRETTGKEYNLKSVSLIDAVRNHSVLSANHTDIVPVAKADNDPYLVATADVANRDKIVGGVTVSTRPLAIGKKVDLLGVSAAAGLINGAQDETDTLDPSLGLGVVYVKVTKDPGGAGDASQVFAINTKGMRGAKFSHPAEGRTSELTLNFNGQLTIKKATKDVAGGAVFTELAAAAAVDSLNDWAISFDVNISGVADVDLGSCAIHGASIAAGAVAGGDNGLESLPNTGILTGFAYEIIGYEPAARRSNTNMRSNGILVDIGTGDKYRLAVDFKPPLSAATPTNENSGATIEALHETQRVRSAGDAVTALFEIKDVLENGSGVANTGAAAGAALVRPTYKHVALNVTTMTVGNQSKDFYADLRETITNAVTTMANAMILESGYEAALSVMAGSKEYEVIVATDKQIKTLLMTSGDPRTLGSGANLRIVASDDDRMAGQVFVTFRRKNVDAADALSFGVHGMVPSLIYKSDTNVSLVQLQPREQHHVMLPVLGNIQVTGLDELFLSKTPRAAV